MGRPFIDLINQRFGHWTVTGPSEARPRAKAGSYRTMWFCTCDCGKTNWVDGTNLRGGISTNCGCQRETTSPKQQAARRAAGRANRKHGMSNHPVYNSYHRMLQRCYDANDVSYPHYGAKGVTVCDRWREPEGFANFLADMPNWKPGLSIERINVFGNYEPSNCTWIPRRLQQRNTRKTIYVPDGMTLRDFCRTHSVNYDSLYYLFVKKGLSFPEALATLKS